MISNGGAAKAHRLLKIYKIVRDLVVEIAFREGQAIEHLRKPLQITGLRINTITTYLKLFEFRPFEAIPCLEWFGWFRVTWSRLEWA